MEPKEIKINKRKIESQIENSDCPCVSTYCERHGKCSKCQAYHRNCGNKTSCGK